MGYQSKTYSLSDEVVEAIESAKAGGTSPNRFLRQLMGLDQNGEEPKRLVSDGPPADLIPPRGGLVGTISVDAEENSATVNVEVDNRPKNCRCRHCPERFAGPRWATICPSCKSGGHTNTPAECPACNEGSAI